MNPKEFPVHRAVKFTARVLVSAAVGIAVRKALEARFPLYKRVTVAESVRLRKEAHTSMERVASLAATSEVMALSLAAIKQIMQDPRWATSIAPSLRDQVTGVCDATLTGAVELLKTHGQGRETAALVFAAAEVAERQAARA